ncbi:MAG: MopE-related protein [Nitrosopumilus sp.]
MQSRGISLALVLSALIFGFSGFLPDAYATDYAISDKQSCEALPVVDENLIPIVPVWDSNTCILDGLLAITGNDSLIINWGVTLEVSENGNLQLGGDVLNLGTISFSGDSLILPNVMIDNFGLLIIQDGATLSNSGELGGDGIIEINGTLINGPRGKVTSLGDINNFGTIENNRRAHIDSDTMNHFSGAYLNNFGTIDISFSNIDGVIDNHNGIDFAGGLSTIGSSGLINNLGQINFDERATLDNYGKFESFEESVVFHGGIINNQASGNFSNSGYLELEVKSQINNFGLLQNNLAGDGICNFEECEDEYEGVIWFLPDEENTFENFGVINNSGTFHNYDTIWNSCGKIDGSLSIESIPPVDDCELIVGIFSPNEGSSFSDVSVIPFLGLAIDKDGFGNVLNFSNNLVWTNSSNDVIGNGAGFTTTISTLGPQTITATESVSQTSSSVNFKIGILDLDGDGASPSPPNHTVSFDCDDNDPLRFEGNPEAPDGVDNDCDNIIPDTEKDDDGDGYIEDPNYDFDSWFGDSSVVGGDDCDDADANRSPGLSEINDGVDNDCDNIIPFYETDDDGDTKAEYEGDCDDDNILRFFGNPEVNDGIDNDCDGLISDEEFDHDGDGYIEAFTVDENHIDTGVVGGDDCNDIDVDSDENGVLDGFPINPGATEDSSNGYGIPNVDDNCDGIVDDNFNVDFDGDGVLPIPLNPTDPFDCDDSNPNRASNQTEIVDGIDNDCSETNFDDGLLDEERDFDGDGFIIGPLVLNPTTGEPIWRDTNHPTVPGENDCDDTSSVAGIRYPTNDEVNDGIDNDCSQTELDDGVPLSEIDNDGDGFTEDLFDPLVDTHIDPNVTGGGDCNDNNDTVYPGADELDDGILNDCLGTLPGHEEDNDMDGYSELQGDCDDTNPFRFINNTEIVDGIDNDCDALQELLPEELDTDNDKQIPGPFVLNSTTGDPIWRGSIFPTNNDGDCDDTNPSIFSGNSELDNGQDDNCDGIVDEGFDQDGDGFTVSYGRDCLDTPIESESDIRFGEVATILTTNIDSANVNQERPELLNHVDDNCDGLIDNMGDKFTSPEFQENLDDKTIKDFEKKMEKLSRENEKLEKENSSLDKKASKYQEKADAARDSFDEEKAAKYQFKADKLYNATASNDSLIDINERQIHVIDVSINNAVIDERTLVLTYDNLTDKAFNDILHDIEKNLKEIEKLEEKADKYGDKADKAREGDTEKAEKYQAKADKYYEKAENDPSKEDYYLEKAEKYQAKADKAREGDTEKAEKYEQKELQVREEIEIIVDLNTVLQCAIDFTPDML